MILSHVFTVRCVFSLTIAFAITTSTNAIAQDFPEISGPMVGHSTESSANIWMYARKIRS